MAQKKILIKINDDFEHGKVEFTLPNGSKLTAYEIGYDEVYTGDQAEPSQYRYRAYGDEFGFDIDEFDSKTVVEYGMLGFKQYDENQLKFCKKVCLYYCKEVQFNRIAEEFEMPEKYLELLKEKKMYG